jgi:hypothetical protein
MNKNAIETNVGLPLAGQKISFLHATNKNNANSKPSCTLEGFFTAFKRGLRPFRNVISQEGKLQSIT